MYTACWEHHELCQIWHLGPLGVPSGKIDDISTQRDEFGMCWCSISTTTTTRRRHCALRTLPDGNHEVLAQCRQEAGGSEGRSCHLLLCSTQGPSREQQQQPTLLPVLGCWRAAHSSLLPAPDDVVGRVVFSHRDSRRQRARKPRAEYTVTATSNDRVNWPLKIPRWTKGTCRRGRANFQLLVDGQAGSSLLLVVRFCFGLLQPRSLAPLGNADKKVQAAWRRGDGGNELVLSRPAESAAPFPNSSSQGSIFSISAIADAMESSTPDPASSQ